MTSTRDGEHIARLRRDVVIAAGISRAWNDDYAAEIDLTDRLGQISCPALVLVGRHDWICGPVWAHVIGNSPCAAVPHQGTADGSCLSEPAE